MATTILGLVIAVLVVGLVELAGLAFHPLPDNVREMSDADLKAHALAAPTAAKLVVVFAWLAGTFAGCWIAGRVAGPGLHWFGLIVGAFMLGACVHSLWTIPSPPWMWVLGMVLPAGGAVAAGRLARWPVDPDEPDPEPPAADPAD
ncbi:MAG: hypothetical protein HKN82_17340 [Akkermansiaceae bacterium]|nr:hypothetical protein [Akkermansiaceae bacterium]NNM30807.1 hypothetical protein [Akkermansiaceae bacterium]